MVSRRVGGGMCYKEAGESLGLMKMFIILIIVIVSLMYTVKIGQICTVYGTLIKVGWAKVGLQLKENNAIIKKQ